MRLIDADALIENEFKNDISYNAFKNLVKRQAVIDAVPVVHGEWIEALDEMDTFFANYCSRCKKYLPYGWEWKPNFCPNCGAKMDGKEKNDD